MNEGVGEMGVLLIVDDEEINVSTLSRLMRRWLKASRLDDRVSVIGACGSSGALTAIRAMEGKRRTFMITDRAMPGGFGTQLIRDSIEVLSRIENPQPFCPVMLTGNVDKRDEALEAGAHAFYHKPLREGEAEDLRRRITSFFADAGTPAC